MTPPTIRPRPAVGPRRPVAAPANAIPDMPTAIANLIAGRSPLA